MRRELEFKLIDSCDFSPLQESSVICSLLLVPTSKTTHALKYFHCHNSSKIFSLSVVVAAFKDKLQY